MLSDVPLILCLLGYFYADDILISLCRLYSTYSEVSVYRVLARNNVS